MLTRIVAALMSIIMFGAAIIPVEANEGTKQMVDYKNTSTLCNIPMTEEEIFKRGKEEFSKMAFDIEWCGLSHDPRNPEVMVKVTLKVTSLKPVLSYGLPDVNYIAETINHLMLNKHLSDEFIEKLSKDRFDVFVEKVKIEPSPSEAETTPKQVDVEVTSEPINYKQIVCQWVDDICKEQGFNNPALIKAIVHCESSFNQYSVSSHGAEGLMQIIPKYFGKLMSEYGVTDLCADEIGNLRIGIHWMQYLIAKYDGNLSKALVAYNCGESVVDVKGRTSNSYSKKVLNIVGDYM